MNDFGTKTKTKPSYRHTETETYRRICEARYVLKMPLIEDRLEYLEQIEKVRGTKALETLKADINKQVKDKANKL